MVVRRPPPMLLGTGVAAVAVALVLVAGLAVDEWPFAFDRRIITGLRAWGGPAWLPSLAIDITALGSPPVLAIIVAAVAGLLFVAGRGRTAAATIVACASGGAVVSLVKIDIARPRPTLVPHLVPAAHASFPSGHAAGSAIVYMTLAALATLTTDDRAVHRYVIGVAVLLVGAIGCSRVYLGVHWPSDVLAGWSFGTLWALGWWWATARLRSRFPADAGGQDHERRGR